MTLFSLGKKSNSKNNNKPTLNLGDHVRLQAGSISGYSYGRMAGYREGSMSGYRLGGMTGNRR